jgi:phosphate transport system substrate-binding protein
MLRWAASYNAKTDVKVNYMAIGSGGGIKQIKAGMVAFGASDKPLPPEELKAAGLAQFPLVIGGVVPVVNLEGIRPGQLAFTGDVLAKIYLGTITSWNDPALVALNPDAKLPDLQIAVTHRSDSSGTTFNWVNYLSKVSPEWKASVGEGTTVKWPVGPSGNGNEGVARYVSYIKGAIGYVELAYAIEHKLVYAKVRNKSGVFVTPSLQSFQAAAANADWTAPDFYEVLTEAAGADSWPITATVFVLMPRQSAELPLSAEALRFFRWSLEQGEADARALNYVPLPAPLVKRVEDYWAANIRER